MKVQSEKTGQGEYTLTIEVEPDRVQKALRKAARELSKRARIPGFRPGKAPYPVVERFLGKDYVYNEAVNVMGESVYKDALDEVKLEPYAQAQIDIAQMEPLVLKAVVPVTPIVEMGDYRSIRVMEPEIVFDASEVDKTLQQIREKHGTWKPVDRPAQLGDQVTIDLKGQVDGRTVINQTSRRTEVQEEMFPQGLAEHLRGMVAGQEIDYDYTYPADDPNPQLAGKTVSFHLMVLQVSEKELPALDDELAKTVGEYETLDDLRHEVEERLTSKQKMERQEKLETEILEKLAAMSSLEYPPVALEREVDFHVQEYRRMIEQQGFAWESYLKSSGKTEDQLREEVRPDAEKTLRESLLLQKVAEEEGIEVKLEDVDAEIERMANRYREQAVIIKAMLSRADSKASIKRRLLLSRAMDRLVEIATGKAEAKAVPPVSPPTDAAAASETPAAEPPAS